MTWRPLIDSASRRASVAEVLGELAAAIDAAFASLPESIGSDGHADRALLRSYLARDATVGDPDDVATRSLIAAIEQRPAGPGLFDGLAHTAWVVAHLTGGDDADEVCGAIEGALVRRLDRATPHHDLISGLAGFGLLAHERRGSESGARLAGRVLDQLERLAVPRCGGLAWHTPPEQLPADDRAECPGGYWNLGLAHGIPGVIALLARFVAAGTGGDRAARLLDGAVDYLLAVAPPRAEGRFPTWEPQPPSDSPGRVAWCYGDLGVALALLAAAQARGRADWRAGAIAIAHGMARRPVGDPLIRDTGLCHGAAGAAHMFHRLYRATGEPELAAAAIRWIDRTLAMRRAGEPIGGFPAYYYTIGYRPVADLVMGATGVGLALHAAISELEPAWDGIIAADL